VDWRWPDPKSPEWRMSEREGVSWFSAGHLTEQGRSAILEHFGLERVADQLPLSLLARRAPNELELMHFGLSGGERQVHRSDRIGDHIEAQLAA
ncbi:MAG: hypothetical protein AAB737_02380, partial [Patescibacteria group bacterium]